MNDSAPAPMLDDALTRELLAFFQAEIEPKVWTPALEALSGRVDAGLAELDQETRRLVAEALSALPAAVHGAVDGAVEGQVERLRLALERLPGDGPRTLKLLAELSARVGEIEAAVARAEGREPAEHESREPRRGADTSAADGTAMAYLRRNAGWVAGIVVAVLVGAGIGALAVQMMAPRHAPTALGDAGGLDGTTGTDAVGAPAEPPVTREAKVQHAADSLWLTPVMDPLCKGATACRFAELWPRAPAKAKANLLKGLIQAAAQRRTDCHVAAPAPGADGVLGPETVKAGKALSACLNLPALGRLSASPTADDERAMTEDLMLSLASG